MSDCCTPSGCTAPAPVAGPPGDLPDRRNRAERRRDARQGKR